MPSLKLGMRFGELWGWQGQIMELVKCAWPLQKMVNSRKSMTVTICQLSNYICTNNLHGIQRSSILSDNVCYFLRFNPLMQSTSCSRVATLSLWQRISGYRQNHFLHSWLLAATQTDDSYESVGVRQWLIKSLRLLYSVAIICRVLMYRRCYKMQGERTGT